MKTENKKGANIDSCGIELDIEYDSEKQLLTLTINDLFF